MYYRSKFKENKKLMPLILEAKKYNSFEEFSRDYSLNQMYGRYWHFTDNPNFILKDNYIPADATNTGKGRDTLSGYGGFMVTSVPSQWSKSTKQLSDRLYAVEVDITQLYKNKDFSIVNRGFGHELYIYKNLNKIKISKLMSYKSALQKANRYINSLPQSNDDLYDIWLQGQNL